MRSPIESRQSLSHPQDAGGTTVAGRLTRLIRLARAPRRPRILLLVDRKGWAFDHSARQIARELRNEFRFSIRYRVDEPRLDAGAYDLIYVFFWGDTYHQRFGFDAHRTLKELSSHRWEDDPKYGPIQPKDVAATFLHDAGTVLCTSRRLEALIQPYHPRVFHTPNGIDPRTFKRTRERRGPLVIGWAGNVQDPVKGVTDILQPACAGQVRLLLAPGNLSHRAMNDFYNQVDVLAVASRHEGEPLTLLEAMAAGCFPVCADVGIVPELVRSGENGIIVPDRTVESFRAAFQWCADHLDLVRHAGAHNEQLIHRERNWGRCAAYFAAAFRSALAYAQRPGIQNDSCSTDAMLTHPAPSPGRAAR